MGSPLPVFLECDVWGIEGLLRDDGITVLHGWDLVPYTPQRASGFGLPMIDERDGRGRGFIRGQIDQESLAIGRHGVLLLLVTAGQWTADNANRKQGRRRSGFQRLAIGRQPYRGGHHLAVQGHVEDFLTVLVPARLCAAVAGDLELPARSRKRLHVDLEPARFVRLVCDPLAVGGELALTFLKGRLKEEGPPFRPLRPGVPRGRL